MNNRRLLTLMAVIVVVAIVTIVTVRFLNQAEVCFKDICFQVEVADTIGERSKGLSFRSDLDEEAGMLFVFDQDGYYEFWMKDTKIPLDIIWINSNHTVVYVENNASVCGETICPSYSSHNPAHYVLEINGGLASKIGISKGSSVTFENIG